MLKPIFVAIALVFATTQAVSAEPAPAEDTAIGYDVSYLDCDTPLPAAFSFALVNVNNGRPYTANPCFASEVAWALGGSSVTHPRLSFYMNTSNPGPGTSLLWPTEATSGPRACDGSWSASCAYDFGWAGALEGFGRAAEVVGPTTAAASQWWLDVETDNSWSDDQTTNVAALTGGIAALRARGVEHIGMYATRSHWAEITGATSPASPINAPFHFLPNWIPRLGTAEDATAHCAAAESLTGGPVQLVQYEFFLDKNIACAASTS